LFDCVLVLFVIKHFTKYTLCCRTHLTTLSHLLAVGGVTFSQCIHQRNEFLYTICNGHKKTRNIINTVFDEGTDPLFALLRCMWNYDWSFKVRCQHTASVAKREDCRSILEWSLCREKPLINAVKVIFYISGAPWNTRTTCYFSNTVTLPLKKRT